MLSGPIDFFIVGAAKSGTSSMQHYLRQHPAIFMPSMKEIHHFAPDILLQEDPLLDPDAYAALFKEARGGQVKGETSAFYLLSAVAAKKIAAHNPDARIIIMLRDPVEFMYSAHAQMVFNGEEEIIEFKEAVEAEEDRMSGKRMPRLTRIPQKHLYKRCASYFEQVQRFMEQFPKEQILILLFDDFKTDPAGVYRKTLRFLGVEEYFQPNFEIVNPSKEVLFPRFQQWIRRAPSLPIFRFFLRVLLPSQASRHRLRELLQSLNSRSKKRPGLDPELVARLRGSLNPDIEKLETLIGEDLSGWKAKP